MQVHILVTGKVQGVFFRKHTQLVATKLELHGWVQNLEDGRVEILAQGNEDALKTLVKWCNRGSPKAKVTNVSAQFSNNYDPALQPFTIQR